MAPVVRSQGVSERRSSGLKGSPMPVKHWTFAGLLLTYWCNARCASCYLCSSPSAGAMVIALASSETGLKPTALRFPASRP